MVTNVWETGWIRPAVESPAIVSPLLPYFDFQFPCVAVSNFNHVAVAGSGVIVNVATSLIPASEAVNVTGVDVLTAFARIANVAEEAPAVTTTVDGRETALPFEADKATTTPPLGAKVVSVTVPVADLPDTIVLGATASAESAAATTGGVTVKLTVFDTPEYDAIRVTLERLNVPELAIAAKVAELEPWETVTLAGTETTPALELERETRMPPAGAGAERVTVPSPDWPGVRLDGLTAKALSATGG